MVSRWEKSRWKRIQTAWWYRNWDDLACRWENFEGITPLFKQSKWQVNNHNHRKSKRVPEKHLLLLYWLCQSLWLCGAQQTVENSSRDGNTRPPDLSPEKSVWGQEATVRTRHGTTDWSQIGKGVCQGYILSPCLFNLYAEYIVQNTAKCWAGWSTKLEPRLPGEISITSDM